jgi:hypothetical protein
LNVLSYATNRETGNEVCGMLIINKQVWMKSAKKGMKNLYEND